MSESGFEKLYAVLGVNEKAGPDELRRAYLALAVKYHPDRNPGDPRAEERFKEISEAYAILTDPAAKARYARMRPARDNASSAGPREKQAGEGTQRPGKESFSEAGGSGPYAGSGADKGEPDLEEILAAFFKSAKGRDLLKDLAGELKKAGLDFKMDDLADWLKSRRQAKKEPGRFGLGAFLFSRLLGKKDKKRLGEFDIHYGLSISSKDSSTGLRIDLMPQNGDISKPIKVQIPAGTKNGQCFKISGLGHDRPDSGRGDLFITVRVA